MLLSMTGFGDARGTGGGFRVSVEVRTVNNRHLKVTVRGTEPYGLLESEFEKVVRRVIRRGSVLVHVRVERTVAATELKLNVLALTAYLTQLRDACAAAGTPELLAGLSAGVLSLPGIAPEAGHQGGPPDDEWPVVEETLGNALKKLDSVRQVEGKAMADELLKYNKQMVEELGRVREHLPRVMADYRLRILERVRSAIGEAGVAVEQDHLIREIAVFADRTEVAEEVTRFAAHLEQFAEVVRVGAEGAGRRLEFVVQEMGREANTMGSKAGDTTVSRHVVEIKATLEKIRELIQNVE